MINIYLYIRPGEVVKFLKIVKYNGMDATCFYLIYLSIFYRCASLLSIILRLKHTLSNFKSGYHRESEKQRFPQMLEKISHGGLQNCNKKLTAVRKKISCI